MDIDAAVAALKDEREKLAKQLAELGATEKGELTGEMEFGDGFADAAAATAERSELIGIVENLSGMLQDVDRALAKTADGSYGSCEGCGKEIGATRMEFRPTSRLCVECKSKR
ncbi:MAG TPA: TraR/DksA C4-type zinc finger protein [Acidimicrobiia bacterium]|nr:TraR/DksA C4-type zinc finger protein [Acidimicrobiia bacterium]